MSLDLDKDRISLSSLPRVPKNKEDVSLSVQGDAKAALITHTVLACVGLVSGLAVSYGLLPLLASSASIRASIVFALLQFFFNPYVAVVLTPLSAWVAFWILVWVARQKEQPSSPTATAVRGLAPSYPLGNLLLLAKGINNSSSSSSPCLTRGTDLRHTITQHLIDLIRAHFQQDDVIRVWMGPFPVYVVATSEAVHELLVSKRDDYVKGFDRGKQVLGNSLPISDGDIWKVHRRVLNPAFKSENLRAIANSAVPYWADVLAKKWEKECQENGGKAAVPIAHELSGAALDIICEAMVGVKVGALEGREGSLKMREAADALITNLLPLSMPILKYVPKFVNGLRFSRKIMEEVAANFLTQYRNEMETKGVDEGSRSLLQLMLKSGQLNDDEMRVNARAFITAGHETTATLLSWTLMELAVRPEEQAKLVAEIDAALPNGEVPCWDDVAKLPYVQATVQEGLRYFAPAQMLPRSSIADTEICNVHIPKGSKVFYAPPLVARDPKNWERAEEFWPERFLSVKDPSAGAPEVHHPGSDTPATAASAIAASSFSPYFLKDYQLSQLPVFGAGPRACIGRQFAINESIILMATILQRFKLSLPEGQVAIPKLALTLKPSDPNLKLVVQPRKRE